MHGLFIWVEWNCCISLKKKGLKMNKKRAEKRILKKQKNKILRRRLISLRAHSKSSVRRVMKTPRFQRSARRPIFRMRRYTNIFHQKRTYFFPYPSFIQQGRMNGWRALRTIFIPPERKSGLLFRLILSSMKRTASILPSRCFCWRAIGILSNPKPIYR